eukprot:6487901-Prymnesium_polylepis.1
MLETVASIGASPVARPRSAGSPGEEIVFLSEPPSGRFAMSEMWRLPRNSPAIGGEPWRRNCFLSEPKNSLPDLRITPLTCSNGQSTIRTHIGESLPSLNAASGARCGGRYVRWDVLKGSAGSWRHKTRGPRVRGARGGWGPPNRTPS